MAGREPSISRRRILGAAACVPVAGLAGAFSEEVPAVADAESWRLLLAGYRRLAARAEQAAERGWFRRANDLYERQCAEIAERFGAASDEGRRFRAAAFARVDRAEEVYWRRCTAPMQQAAVALALAPAPDLAALRAKIGVMRAHALEELAGMTRHPLDVVDEDLGRLMGAGRDQLVRASA